MDLIEQLGGYEQLKGYIDGALRGMPDSYCYKFDTVLGRGKLLNMRDVKCTLLEYRRQHNIFEVGDFIFHPMFGALFEIKRIAEKYVVASTKSEYETNLLIELISHATPEEIEAGHRL